MYPSISLLPLFNDVHVILGAEYGHLVIVWEPYWTISLQRNCILWHRSWSEEFYWSFKHSSIFFNWILCRRYRLLQRSRLRALYLPTPMWSGHRYYLPFPSLYFL